MAPPRRSGLGQLVKLLQPVFGDDAERKLRRSVDIIRRTVTLVYAKPAKGSPTFRLGGSK